MKAADLIGPALDWAAGLAEGHEVAVSPSGIIAIRRRFNGIHVSDVIDYFDPSTNPGWGHPIIEREGISVIRCDDEYGVDRKGFTTSKRIPVWCATTGQHGTHSSYEGEHYPDQYEISESDVIYGPTALVAAMRCWVTHKLGAEIDIPKELQ